MVEVKHVDVEPPLFYDEKKIKKDLIQMSLRGYSLVPYQTRIRSKLYYKFHRNRIDEFFKLVEAEKELFGELKAWMIAIEELKMVHVDIERMKYEKLLARDQKKKEYEDFIKDSSVDRELKDLRKRKDILELKDQLERLEKKLNKSDGEQVNKIEKDKHDTIAALEATAEILIKKKQIIKNIKQSVLAKDFSEEEIKQMIDEFESMAVKSGFLPDTSQFK